MKRGPKTEAGKEAVRLNASKHGILSNSPVIPRTEREGDWLAHRDGVIESLKPEDYLELELAERVALNLWKLRRAARFESETLAIAQDRIDEGAWFVGLEKEIKMDAKFASALKSFAKMEHEDEVSDALYHTVFQVMGVVFGDEDSQDESGYEIRSAEGSLTAGDVWKILDAAFCSGPTAEEVLQRHISRYESTRTANEKRLTALNRKHQRARSLKLLLDEPDLSRVQRYETPLFRQTWQILHELEALQSRRRGDPIPTARIDVIGMPEA